MHADDKEIAPGRPTENGWSRKAWIMWLKPGSEEIYKEKHDSIWPEMLALMKQRGIRNYSIYRYGPMLFAYLEHDGAAADDEPPDPVLLQWWKMMEPYMICNPDGSPHQEAVQEMFHTD